MASNGMKAWESYSKGERVVITKRARKLFADNPRIRKVRRGVVLSQNIYLVRVKWDSGKKFSILLDYIKKVEE